jgi:hypothetical protein
MSNIKEVKLCCDCNEVKLLETGYYRAGKSWQKRCKLCHNKGRYDYKMSMKNYVPSPKGFTKLTEDTQKKIIYDIYVKINYKKIAIKYNLKYPTLLSWKRKGLIPQYVEPVIES